ncbi:MAG: hypothetical protein Q9M44_05685 [Ghiorsea sp.]|nr:hypothetical protein [Ghiorsea sp.]
MSTNYFLLVGGLLSIGAAVLHVYIIIEGGDMYRKFGAGEKLAAMDEAGSWYPAVLTSGIALVLFAWGLYAFSGAGIIQALPMLQPALVVISTIYLLRGLVLIPLWVGWSEQVNGFVVWSSLASLGFGLCHAMGTWQVWNRL